MGDAPALVGRIRLTLCFGVFWLLGPRARRYATPCSFNPEAKPPNQSGEETLLLAKAESTHHDMPTNDIKWVERRRAFWCLTNPARDKDTRPRFPSGGAKHAEVISFLFVRKKICSETKNFNSKSESERIFRCIRLELCAQPLLSKNYNYSCVNLGSLVNSYTVHNILKTRYLDFHTSGRSS